jgi:hypothetical protein
VIAIRALDPAAVDARGAELACLLIDAVEGGASIGFLGPLPEIEAQAYWRSIVDAVVPAGGICWRRSRATG